MRVRRFGLAPAFLGLLACASASGGGEVSFYGGVARAKNGVVKTLSQDEREVRTTIEESGPVGGMRVAGFFDPHFGIEWDLQLAGLDHVATLSDTSDPSDPDPVLTEETTDALFSTHLNLLAQVPVGPLIPYATAGGGYFLFVDEPAPSWNYGGGVKVSLSEKVALRLDAREYRLRLRGSIEEAGLVEASAATIGPAKSFTGDASIGDIFSASFEDPIRIREITLGITIRF